MAVIRDDPYTSFNFVLEIGGIIVGGFSEISGLQVETEFEEYREGGMNDHIHKFPKITKYQNLVLKHGMTDRDLLWKWYDDVIQGNIKRKDGIIFILSPGSSTPKMWWEFTGAYPVKWTGPDLRADSNSVAFETLELVHNGLTRSSV